MISILSSETPAEHGRVQEKQTVQNRSTVRYHEERKIASQYDGGAIYFWIYLFNKCLNPFVFQLDSNK